ncbi:glycoside hydrolase [Astrocystis sublimbata]|nr:glycoside hydrolase [Astrocystis sublimbata]
MKTSSSSVAIAAVAFAHAGMGLQLNAKDSNSVKEAAKTVAKGLYVFHNEEATTGQFNQPQPWFWWLSGSGWTGLMDYTVYTKDNTYKADLLSALGKNVGPNFDFMPPEQASWEANDDQAYWLYSALTAMEYDFDTLPGAPSWDKIAANTFDLFASRWNDDSDTCGGGLKWQFDRNANGWTYKNSVTNGAFFQTSARLARYTGEQKYADWAIKIWDWSRSVGLVSDDYHVYDGTSDEDGANCTKVNPDQWSYNIATYLHGAAHMYNFTGDATWEERVQGFVDTAAKTYFTPAKTGVMYEQKCEPGHGCTTDQTSFKASLSRWLGKTAVLVPSVKTQVMDMLERSAQGAAQSCVGHGNSTCGVTWSAKGFDGQSDFGVELSALETIQSLLVFEAPPFAVAHAGNETDTTTETPPAQTSVVPSSSHTATTTKLSATSVATTLAQSTTVPATSTTVDATSSVAASPSETTTAPVKSVDNPPTHTKCGARKHKRRVHS